MPPALKNASPGRRRNAIPDQQLYDSKTGRKLILQEDGQHVVRPTFRRVRRIDRPTVEKTHVLPFWSQSDNKPNPSPENRRELRLHPSVVAEVEKWRKTGAPDVKSKAYLTACDRMYQEMLDDKAMVETWSEKDESKMSERTRQDAYWSCDTMSGAHFMDAILRWYARPPWADDNASFLWSLFNKEAVPLPAPVAR